MTLNALPLTYGPLPLLQQLAPLAASDESGNFTGSSQGDVNAPLTAVDISLAMPCANASG